MKKITKNYANLMYLIKICKKTKIYNILKQREYVLLITRLVHTYKMF